MKLIRERYCNSGDKFTIESDDTIYWGGNTDGRPFFCIGGAKFYGLNLEQVEVLIACLGHMKRVLEKKNEVPSM